jgi:cytochrome c oxidase subunit 2
MRLRVAGLCIIAAVLLGQPVYGQVDASIFHPSATPAQSEYDLALLVLAVCAAIFLVVAGLLTYVIVKFRHRGGVDEHEPAQIYGSNQIEIAWTVIPILIVVVLTMTTARVIAKIQDARAPQGALEATVIGHQWWWEIRYPSLGIVTANELHVPVSTAAQAKPIYLTLLSADVAHSFWVPRLAGKTDVIPGRTNRMWIDPRETGAYVGNCAEYCGTQHANMLIRVIVHPQDEFDRWVAAQKQAAAADSTVEAGRATFLALSCVSCHTVSGTAANGQFGPDLSHLASRDTIGSGVIKYSLENLRAWIKNPQLIKPGNLMPDMQLTEKELDQVTAYLATLK